MKKLIRSEKGQGLVEYALILVLVAIVVLAVLLLLGPTVGNAFSNIVANLQRFSGGGSGPIDGVSAVRVGSSVSVDVTVSSNATISVSATSGTVTPASRMCTTTAGSCQFNISGASATGTVTVTTSGGTRTTSWN